MSHILSNMLIALAIAAVAAITAMILDCSIEFVILGMLSYHLADYYSAD